MRWSLCGASLALLVGLAGGWADPVAADDVAGVYLVQNGEAHIELLPCGEQLCGRIVWLRDPLDEQGQVPRDDNNPDPKLRVRPILGLQILTGLKPAAGSDEQWTGGSIYDPESGKTYRCKLRHDGGDQVRLRGYLGISLLGRTTRWTRVAARAAGVAMPVPAAGSE